MTGAHAPSDHRTPSFVRPERLRPGDTVAAVCLSSGFVTQVPSRFAAGVRQVRDTFGLNVVAAPNALRGPEFLYEHPEARADDLHWALTNPDVRGVFSVIGGDDSVRLLPYLDLALIGAHPKVFMGFSDTTVTLLAFLRAGVAAFYGPALLTDLAENGGVRPFVARAVRRALFDAEPFALEASPDVSEESTDWGDAALQEVPRTFVPSRGWSWLQGERRAEGHLVGGCMEVLDMLVGTPGWPEPDLWNGAVLCLETSEDVPPPAQVGYWLRNYGAQGLLGRLSGLMFARPRGYTPETTAAVHGWIARVLREFGREDLPVVAGVDFGHTSPQLVLPFGSRAELDPARRAVRVLEPGVR
ncbi:S66 family peptidase [Deinococcus pimensis]|uniref:S66 family peptidase n=1 Tax=Deinococcus pimensis TaxID=309888 RepID=UPI0004B8F10F|nr:S66 peptidase family protein [Deinococcus pimensis]